MAQRMTYEEKTKNSWALIYHFTLIVPQSLISYLEELKIKCSHADYTLGEKNLDWQKI